jgi:Protein of unknown function (DUF3531)
MQVEFREFDPFDVWLWIEFPLQPSDRERQFIEEVFDSWFYLGKLGAFNAESLQVQDTGLEISYMTYDSDRADESMMALMHNQGEFEYERNWGRCWLDLGTSDALALDYVQIERLIIGGENDDWKVPTRANPEFVDDEWN